MKPKPSNRIPTEDLPDIKRIREREVWIQNRFIQLTKQGTSEADARTHLASIFGLRLAYVNRLTGGKLNTGETYPSAQTQLMGHRQNNRHR